MQVIGGASAASALQTVMAPALGARLVEGQEITEREMVEQIIRHRIGVGFLETSDVWHACMRADVSASACCYFEAHGETIFDAVAILRARLGNELYRTLYADAIAQRPYPVNLREA